MQGESDNKYWIFIMPVLLCGIIYYAYNKGGFISEWLRGLVDPLIHLGQGIVNVLFGTSF
jgi:ABC-type uncharacterized transport system permease subunit